jgi:hypothetical protein
MQELPMAAFRCALAIIAASISCLLLTTTASTSYASCGDWLQHDDKSSLADVQGDAKAGVGKGFSKHWPVLPCRGPNCTRVPMHPAPSPVSNSFDSAKSALLCFLTSLSASTYETIIPLAGIDQPARGFPSSIDHPPRAEAHFYVACWRGFKV